MSPHAVASAITLSRPKRSSMSAAVFSFSFSILFPTLYCFSRGTVVSGRLRIEPVACIANSMSIKHL